MSARLRRGGQAQCKLIRALAPLLPPARVFRFIHSFRHLGHLSVMRLCRVGDVDRVPPVSQVIPSIVATSFYIHDFNTHPHTILSMMPFACWIFSAKP